MELKHRIKTIRKHVYQGVFMKHKVTQSLNVNVSADKIWQVLGKYNSLENYASTVESSSIVGNIESGLGAKRKNTFYDGSSLIEEVTEYQQGQGYKMKLSDFSFPLKYMNSEVAVKAIDSNSCTLFMSTEFVVKAGPFGWLMGLVIMRPMMKNIFKKQMNCLAYYCETGQKVNNKLPSSDDLKKLVLG